MKYSKNINLNEHDKSFTISMDGEDFNISHEKVINMLVGRAKVKRNAKVRVERNIIENLNGNTYRHDAAIKKRDRNIQRLLRFDSFIKLKDLYTKNKLGIEIKRKHNAKSNTKKYTIKDFYIFIRSHVKIEMMNEKGLKMEKVRNPKDLHTISIRVLGGLK